MVVGANRRSEADRRREMKIGRGVVIVGAVGLVWPLLWVFVDPRAALSAALGPLFLLSLGGRVVLAQRRPAAARLFALLAGLLPLALVVSFVERIASAR